MNNFEKIIYLEEILDGNYDQELSGLVEYLLYNRYELVRKILKSKGFLLKKIKQIPEDLNLKIIEN